MSELKIDARVLEHVPESTRSVYAPTPLNPYDVRIDGVSYILDAQASINQLFEKNLEKLDVSPTTAVVGLLQTSIHSALFRRFGGNSNKSLAFNCDDISADLFSKACLGEASMDELVALLARKPEALQSLEIAKQTHPFDWNATADMDNEVDVMMAKCDFSKFSDEATQNARYIYMRADVIDNPTAMILVRKTDFGDKHIPDSDESIRLVQRDSLVLDLNVCNTSNVKKEAVPWMQQEDVKKMMGQGTNMRYGGKVLKEFLNAQYAIEPDQRSPAVYPGVRSYYAYVHDGSERAT